MNNDLLNNSFNSLMVIYFKQGYTYADAYEKTLVDLKEMFKLADKPETNKVDIETEVKKTKNKFGII